MGNKMFFFQKNIIFFVLFFLLALFFLIGLLKGPIVPNEIQSKNCARNVTLPFGGGVTLNCDSGMYVRLAKNPSLLFEEERVVHNRILTAGNVEQATPGSTYLVWLISQPIYFIWKYFDDSFSKLIPQIKNSLNEAYLQQDIDQTIDDSFPNFKSFLPSYVSYVVFHFLLILLTFILYIKTLYDKTLNLNLFAKPFLWLGSFLLINDIVKQFFFSPGPQLFRIFAPIITIYFSKKILESKNANKDFFVGTVFIGIGMLFYFNFFISVLTIGFAWLIKSRFFYEPINFIKKQYLNFLISIIIFTFPYFTWYIICLITNEGLFIYDLDQRNNGIDVFKIIFREEGFNAVYKTFFYSIINTYKRSLIHSWHILAILFSFLLLLKFKLTNLEKNLLITSLFYSFFIILFFCIYKPTGEPRLVFSGFLIFLPLIGEMSKRILNLRKKSFGILIFLVFLFSAHVINKNSPYGWYNNDGYYFFEE